MLLNSIAISRLAFSLSKNSILQFFLKVQFLLLYTLYLMSRHFWPSLLQKHLKEECMSEETSSLVLGSMDAWITSHSKESNGKESKVPKDGENAVRWIPSKSSRRWSLSIMKGKRGATNTKVHNNDKSTEGRKSDQISLNFRHKFWF